ncbi:MAG: hypothetical protein JOY90_04575 [Bradyrhizobium sp.]|uniref:hypothetical protein n=1 Tax=Bradyrhizobium sp. TaxID=376 RepID=UPI001D32403C|nr:hypothetical protein [Bradyrhizobium sp.]MBV9559725.1 hypothetical protein [Bradyrhizobium sp.]
MGFSLNPLKDISSALQAGEHLASKVVDEGAKVVEDGAKGFASAMEDAAKVASHMSLSDLGHTALDVASFVPGLGTVTGLVNAGWYAAEGDWGNAALSAATAIPIAGDFVDAAKVGKDALTIGKDVEKGVKLAEEAETAARVAKDGKDVAQVGGHATELSKGAEEIEQIFRSAGKTATDSQVSLKQLRMVLGRAGVSPSPYSLVKVPTEISQELEKAGAKVWGWVSRDAAGAPIRDARGRPIINFTERGLSSLEESVKTFGHEVQHLKDFAAGIVTAREADAERAGEQLWRMISKLIG